MCMLLLARISVFLLSSWSSKVTAILNPLLGFLPVVRMRKFRFSMGNYRTLRYMRQLFIVYNRKALVQPYEDDGLFLACSFGLGTTVGTSTLHHGSWNVLSESRSDDRNSADDKKIVADKFRCKYDAHSMLAPKASYTLYTHHMEASVRRDLCLVPVGVVAWCYCTRLFIGPGLAASAVPAAGCAFPCTHSRIL